MWHEQIEGMGGQKINGLTDECTKGTIYSFQLHPYQFSPASSSTLHLQVEVLATELPQSAYTAAREEVVQDITV